MYKLTNGHLIFFSIFLLLSSNISSQNDPEAVKILDKFSATALGAPSVSMKFQLITIDQTEKTNDTREGSIILNKDKYRLELPDNIIWFNGETSWSYLPAEKEVTIAKADKNDNSFMNRPSAIFSAYKNGYKCRLIEDNSDSYIIDLYPEDNKNDLIRLRLNITKPGMELKSLEYKKKDGIVTTLYVLEYSLKVKPEQDTFSFRIEKYKGVEVVDIR
jgi:outer membrane lipoprotein carrier protein